MLLRKGQVEIRNHKIQDAQKALKEAMEESPNCMPFGIDRGKNGGLVHSVVVHGELDESGGSRGARLPLSMVRNRASRPPISL